MSWTDDEIDKLVQESASRHKVEYKDAYWKEMEAMLDQGKSRKAGFWWWMSGVVLLIGGATTMMILNSTVHSTNTISANKSSSIALATLGHNPENATTELEHTAAEIQNKSTKIEIVKAVPLADKQSRARKSSAFRNSESTLQRLTFTPSGSQVNFENFNIRNGSVSVIPAGIIVVENEKNEYANDFDASKATATESSNNQSLQVNNLDQNPLVSSFFGELQPNIGDLPIFPRKRVGFYAGVNTGIGQSYLKTRANNDMYQIGIDAGVEVFKNNWTFGAGLGIKQQYLRNVDLTLSRQFYSYGLVNVSSNLKYDQLIFADLNVNVSYSVRNSSFGIALTPNYLLGARLSYNQTTQETVGYETHVLSKESENHKYVTSKNFRQFGLNAGVTYSYVLPRNYLIQMELNTRIGDRLLQSTFDGKNSKLPLMLEVGIKKRF